MWTTVPLVVLMAVLPKCPACLVVYGSLFAATGVSSFIAGPLATILAGASILLFGLCAVSRRSPMFGLLGATSVVLICWIGRDRGHSSAAWLGLVLLMIGFIHEVGRDRRGDSCRSR